MNPRTCIVSRKTFDHEELIRFVAGPDGSVVPDLKENLPGRGVRVEARRECVQAAVNRQLFGRALKTDAKADASLASLVETLLEERMVQAFAMARKAGLLITGFAKVDAALRDNKADALFHASDAAEDGRRKLASAVALIQHLGGAEVPVFDCLSCDQMSAALGLGNVNHAAALPGGATRHLIAAARRLKTYRGKAAQTSAAGRTDTRPGG